MPSMMYDGDMNTTSFSHAVVLVAGAAGFIPSHLCEALLNQGATVLGIDNFISGRESNLSSFRNHPKFTFLQADITKPTADLLPGWFRPTHIFHMASPASPPGYQKHPVETYMVNAFGTHHLLQYMKEFASDATFLYASTSEVYGNPLEHPQKETYWGNVNPNGIRSCYDESKRLGETICGVHSREYDMDVRIVRIFNTYGPRMDPNDGRVIPQLMTQAVKNEPFTIYGDGKQTRSLCYVSDLVDGLLRLSSEPNAKNETVNLGNPDERTVQELADLIQTISGCEGHKTYAPLPKDDPTRRQPDISKAKSLLGWEPKVSLREGLTKTFEYFQDLS